MPLESFGAILTFAAQLEEDDGAFFAAAALNPAAGELASVLVPLSAEAAKAKLAALRARQENVTEMILEPITGFTRQPFASQRPDPAGLDQVQILETCLDLSERAAEFYAQAADHLGALPEVARVLRLLGKKRVLQLERLERL